MLNHTQSIAPAATLPYHLHTSGYFAVVLRGRYTEASESGRIRVAPGHVIYHPPFQSHFDRVEPTGAVVLNIAAGSYHWPEGWLAALPDVERVVRLAASSSEDAIAEVVDRAIPQTQQRDDWPDLLAVELLTSEGFQLRDWARMAGLSPEAVSRGFRKTYGTPPSRFRMHARIRRTWHDLTTTDLPLAEIACARGFADQAHMTRDVYALTLQTPGAWRRNSRPVDHGKRPARSKISLARS